MRRQPRRARLKSILLDFAGVTALIVAAISGFLVLAVVLILFGRNDNGDPYLRPPEHPMADPCQNNAGEDLSNQARYVCEILRDRNALYNGEAIIPRSLNGKVGDAVPFTVQVKFGTVASEPTPAATDVALTVPVGARVGVSVATDDPADVNVARNTPNAQPVIAPGDSAEWHFEVTGNEPGKFTVHVAIYTLDGASDRTLTEEVPMVPFTVSSTTSYLASKRGNQVVWAGGVLAAIAAITGLLWKLRDRLAATPLASRLWRRVPFKPKAVHSRRPKRRGTNRV